MRLLLNRAMTLAFPVIFSSASKDCRLSAICRRSVEQLVDHIIKANFDPLRLGQMMDVGQDFDVKTHYQSTPGQGHGNIALLIGPTPEWMMLQGDSWCVFKAARLAITASTLPTESHLSVISSFREGPWSKGLPNLKGGCGCFLWVMARSSSSPGFALVNPRVLRPAYSFITTLFDFTNSHRNLVVTPAAHPVADWGSPFCRRLQVIVESPLSHERLMGPLLDDAAVVHDQDAVGPADGGETVGDDDAGAVGQGGLNGLFDEHLGFRVHVGGGFVQHQDARVAGQHPGKGQELLLAGGKVQAALADAGFQPLGEGPSPRLE